MQLSGLQCLLQCLLLCALNFLMQKNQGILLGVVGTDIPLQELTKLIPKHMVCSAVLWLQMNECTSLYCVKICLAFYISLCVCS